MNLLTMALCPGILHWLHNRTFLGDGIPVVSCSGVARILKMLGHKFVDASAHRAEATRGVWGQLSLRSQLHPRCQFSVFSLLIQNPRLPRNRTESTVHTVLT